MTDAKLDMSLEDATSTQRAIRRLKTDPVDDALVLRLLELATMARRALGLPWDVTG
jgi:hypothetical protein